MLRRHGYAPEYSGSTNIDIGEPICDWDDVPMRLLLIGNNYKPEPTGIGVITAEFAERMADRGHTVTVATTFPNYPQWSWQGGRRLFKVEELAGVTVRRMWTPLPRNRSTFWRVVFDTGFTLTSLINAGGAHRPEVVIAICPPVQVAFTATLLGRLWRVPTCLWIKDLPLDLALEVGMVSRGSLTHRFGAALERLAYRSCSELIVIHERFARVIKQKGVPKEQITSIPNWVDDTPPVAATLSYRGDLGAGQGDFLILHAGNMGAKQGLANILAAASMVHADEKIKFALMGDGPRRDSVIAEAGRLNLTSMAILPLQAANQVPYYYAAADALLLDQVANVIDSVVPMKLLSYMAAGKPILAAVHPESVTAEILDEAGCGLLVPPDDPVALAAGARQLAECPDLAKLGHNARTYMEENFATAQVMAKWEELLTTLSGASRES